jgi:hypothetical protein
LNKPPLQTDAANSLSLPKAAQRTPLTAASFNGFSAKLLIVSFSWGGWPKISPNPQNLFLVALPADYGQI